jgi:hypothetical protein
MRRPALALVLAIFFSHPLWAVDPHAGLLLPAGAKAAWVLAPGRALPATTRFDVDPDGRLWLLPVSRILSCSSGLMVALEKEVRDFAFSSQSLRLATDSVAGGLTLHKTARGLSGKVDRKLILPEGVWRLAKGGPDGVVAFGWEAENGHSVLYRVDDRRKVLVWPERVLAAEGTASAWFLATPGGIVRVSRQGEAKRWGSLPGGISSLAWVEGAGLVAAGPQGAALFKDAGKLLPLVVAKSPRVRARGNALYVLLPEQGGVLKITGLAAPGP